MERKFVKQKELKNLAKKIAKLEMIIQSSDNSDEISRAQEEMIRLSSHVDSLDDVIAIDELVMEILQKEKKES